MSACLDDFAMIPSQYATASKNYSELRKEELKKLGYFPEKVVQIEEEPAPVSK